MWPLLQKEWHFIKPLIARLILLGLPIFFTVLIFSVKLNPEGIVASMTGGLSFMLVYSFIFQSGYHEDKIGGLTFLRSLPLSCQKIVGVKFLVILLLCVTALLTTLFILLVSGLMGIIQPESLDHFWATGLSSLASVLIVGSVMQWSFFRFGYSKMGWALLVMSLVLPLLIGVVGFVTLKAFPGIYVVFSEADFVLIMLLVAAAVLSVSMLDAVRALRGRDLT